MKIGFLAPSAFTALFAVGFALAQQAPPPRPHFGPGGPPRDLETRLTQHLGLTAVQQNAVHTIIAERQVATKGMREQMHTLHTALTAAIKAGNESQIEKANLEVETLHQQQTTIHAKSIAKIYAALTPAQQAKVGAHLEMLMDRGGPGPRGRMGPPPQGQARPAPPAQQQ
jgi:Spy/CpxP family protein refolding chaperone